MRFTLPAASLCEHQIAHILSRALPRHALKSFEPLTGGLINVMYRLRAEGLQEAFVLRVYSRDPSACGKMHFTGGRSFGRGIRIRRIAALRCGPHFAL